MSGLGWLLIVSALSLDLGALVEAYATSRKRLLGRSSEVNSKACREFAPWGMFIGSLFFAPWLGLVVGAAGGALGSNLTDVSVDDNFIQEVGTSIEPGQAALFSPVQEVTHDKVMPELQSYSARVLQTSDSNVDEHKLREDFGGYDE